MIAENTEGTKVIHVLAERLPEAIHELDKLVRKAKRYGNPDVGYVIGEVYREKEVRKRFDGTEVIKLGPERVKVEIIGDAPRVGNYEFLAKIDHGPGSNILDIVPGKTVDARFRTVKCHCEHCKVYRRRNETFVLGNVDTGEQVQVGRTCLKDFLGYCDPAQVAQRFAFFKSIRDLEESWGGRWGSVFPADEVVALTFAAIRLWGWTSKGMAMMDERLLPTAHYVGLVLDPPPDLHKDHMAEMRAKRNQLIAEVKDADWARGEEVVQWVAQGGAGDSDYGHNLKAVFERQLVEYKRLGLVCSAVQAFERAHQREVERAQSGEKASEWVGEVGERLRGIEVTQESARVVGSSQFGELDLIKFVDKDGNVFTWFTGSGSGLNNGDKAIIDGTVKRHTEFKGARETQLTRCKVRKI